MATETVAVELSTDDETDTIEVPVALIEALQEGDETAPQVVGDIAVLGLAQQAHGMVHHGHGGVSDDLAEAESRTMELFEERFGRSYAEMTGHDH